MRSGVMMPLWNQNRNKMKVHMVFLVNNGEIVTSLTLSPKDEINLQKGKL